MRRYIFQRVYLAIFTVAILCVLIFYLQSAFGNDPIASNSEAFVSEFPKNTPIKFIVDTVREREGFNRPIFVRFFAWLAGVFSGNPGKIYSAPDFSIPATIFSPLRFTILVTLPALLISYTLGILIGLIAAVRKDRLFDRISVFFTNIFVAIPSFVVSTIIIIIALSINIPAQFRRAGILGNTYWDTALSLIPPLIALVLPQLAGIIVLVRNLTVSVLGSNFIFFARTRGLTKRKIFFSYVLRNALVPLLSGFIVRLLSLYSGSWVVEQIFGIPGSSLTLINWTISGEINVIMFNVFYISTFFQLVAILSDISYWIMDPRIKFGSQNYQPGLIVRGFKGIKSNLKERFLLLSEQRQQKRITKEGKDI